MERKSKLAESNYQHVIKTARVILVKNIVPCQELYDKLKKNHVFPETMLDEIRVSNFFAFPLNRTLRSRSGSTLAVVLVLFDL